MPSPCKPPPRIFKLRNGVKNYEWGKKGSQSFVGVLATEVTCNGIKMNEDDIYAEMWVGTHPGAPSFGLLEFCPNLLSELITRDPTLVNADGLASKFPSLREGQLPFLLKVRSCNTALPLQPCPCGSVASQMAADVDVSGRSKHVSRIGICIQDYEGLLGFLSPQQIQVNLEKYIPAPVLKDVLREDSESLQALREGNEELQKAALARVFSRFLDMEKPVVERIIQLVLDKAPDGQSEDSTRELIRRLNGQHPGDVGPLFMNHVKLKAGDAIVVEKGCVQACIEGDIIECITAGSTAAQESLSLQNPEDRARLKSALLYDSRPSESLIASWEPFSKASSTHSAENIPCHCKGFTTLVGTQSSGLSLLRCRLPFEGASEVIEPLEGPSIIVTIRGDGYLCADGFHRKLNVGESWFIAPWVETRWKAGEDGWEFYRAFVEP
ncbi:Mannose-6-phosphate isomerase [Tulasnella sp. 403]|nr:Mannose-6-phosphate isomerase [Tulasnella sp. 403]